MTKTNFPIPVLLLGATGNIGFLSLDSLKKLHIPLLGISFYNNLDLALKIVNDYKVPHLFCLNHRMKPQLESLRLKEVTLHFGEDALESFIASYHEQDFRVINAMSGITGLKSSQHTLERGKTLILANKESVILGGALLTKLVQFPNQLIPIDSEHFSLFFLRALLGSSARQIKRMIITASGGPFLRMPLDQFSKISVKDALNHPIWKDMGYNITLSSATLANKGLEIMEVKELFNVDLDQIKVLIHPQAQTHAMVELSNGSTLSHQYGPNMKVPILHALTFPDIPTITPFDNQDDIKNLPLHEYLEVDPLRFPMLSLAYDASKAHYTQVLYTVANDFANEAYIEGRIKFIDIYEFVHYILHHLSFEDFKSITEIIKYIEHTIPIIRNQLKEFCQ